MTDLTGIVEHAVFTVPNYPEGYSTDDNARALIVAILLEELGSSIPAGSSDLAARYLAFCGWHSTQQPRDLETASAMNANGRNRKVRKTVMAAHYGD